jgi:hypothetical protein
MALTSGCGDLYRSRLSHRTVPHPTAERIRSLRLNFELDVEIYDATTAALIAGVIQEKRARRLAAEELARRGLLVRLCDAAVRLTLPYV